MRGEIKMLNNRCLMRAVIQYESYVTGNPNSSHEHHVVTKLPTSESINKS